jgi:hypothetical protein
MSCLNRSDAEPSLVRYWTVVNESERVVRVVDEYLQHLRLGQDPAENTTNASTEARAQYVRWWKQAGRDWQTAERVHHLSRAGALVTSITAPVSWAWATAAKGRRRARPDPGQDPADRAR